jgi:glycerate kinase
VKKTILLAPNSFKESADSVIISKILFEELRKGNDFSILEKPLSDGGDGFLTVCNRIFNGEFLTYYITNTYNDQINPVNISYSKENKALYIESAEVVGLKKVPKERRNPMILNTYGLGDLVFRIVQEVHTNKLELNKLVIGVGGTATVDFGFGLANAFGLKLLDVDNNEIDVIPSNFIKTARILLPEISLPFQVQVIADVKTPLFGKNNAIEIYSGQKGADREQIRKLNIGFDNVYNLLLNNVITKPTKVINGAGGGLAAGLDIFFDAEIIQSKDFILHQILNDLKIDEIGAVVTGEGAFDNQSFENKGAYVIVEKFAGTGIPLFLVCGTVEKSAITRFPSNVKVIELLKYFGSIEESIKKYEIGLRKAAKEIKNHLKN